MMELAKISVAKRYSKAQNLEILKKIVQNVPYFDEFNEFKKHLMNVDGLKGKFFETS